MISDNRQKKILCLSSGEYKVNFPDLQDRERYDFYKKWEKYCVFLSAQLVYLLFFSENIL